MKRKGVLIVLAFIAILQSMQSQQDAQYTQYMYNTLAINPAYAGSRGVLSIAGLHRSQWLGIDGAPTTQTLNFNTPISRRVGIGFSAVNDEIGNGTRDETYFDATFSYTVPFRNDAKLSFGLKVGGHLLNIDYSQLSGFIQEQSVNGLQNVDNQFSPNFGAGVYYHTEEFYVGLSIPNFLETSHFNGAAGANSFLARERMNFFMITGYVMDLNRNVKLKPAFLVKAEQGAPIQVDFSATALFNEKFSLGAAYRLDAAFSALMGFQLSNQLMLGLSYDREITALGNASFNDGSFEVFMRYELFTRHTRVLTPRFF